MEHRAVDTPGDDRDNKREDNQEEATHGKMTKEMTNGECGMTNNQWRTETTLVAAEGGEKGGTQGGTNGEPAGGETG